MDFRKMIVSILIYLFLLICSIQDIKEKRISMKILAGFGIFFFAASFLLVNLSFGQRIWNLLPGMAAVLAAFMTKEQQIGYGDGICLLILGNVVSVDVLLAAVMCCLLLMAAYSLILLFRKKADRKTTLPMIPFLMAGMVFQAVIGKF